MRGDWTKAKIKRTEVVDYAEDGSPIIDEFPDVISVVAYYDRNGTFLGRTFDEPLWCLIGDETEKKLDERLKKAGAVLTKDQKWGLACAVHDAFYFSEEQFWTRIAIRNQEALKQLISAYEALTCDEQETLTESFLNMADCKLPMARNSEAPTFLRAAKGLLDKGEGGNPPTFQGALSSLRQEMEKRFASFGLKPADKDKQCFEEWMTILLKDPGIKEMEKEWESASETDYARLKEKMPDTVRGKKTAKARKQQSDVYSASRRSEWPQYTDFLNAYFKRSPTPSLTTGRNACANEFLVSLKTIERRTKGYQKPS